MLQSNVVRWLLVLAVVIGVYALYRWLVVTSIEVTSEPSGAVVALNGERLGVTPFRADIRSGAQRLEVQHSHFTVYRELIDFAGGDHVKRHVELQVGEGSLRLLSNPKGAWVEIDGERVPGVTPLRVDLASGQHEIMMGQAERKSRGELVQVISDETVELNLELPIDPHGTLSVNATPKDARIELVGGDLEYTPKMRVPIGEYGVEVSRPGYVAQSLRFLVRYGDNVKSVDLEREYGRSERGCGAGRCGRAGVLSRQGSHGA